MGLVKNFLIELEEQERTEYEELKDMKLEEEISLLEKEIEDKTEEMQSLKNEISELDRDLIGKREQLDRYKELQLKYQG